MLIRAFRYTPANPLLQVMKAGVDAAQRRRMGENGLVVAMDPATQRLLRHEEVIIFLTSAAHRAVPEQEESSRAPAACKSDAA